MNDNGKIPDIPLTFWELFLIALLADLGVSVPIALLLAGTALATVVVAYIRLRIVVRIIGTRMDGRLSGMDTTIRRRIGLSMSPQTGIATLVKVGDIQADTGTKS